METGCYERRGGTLTQTILLEQSGANGRRLEVCSERNAAFVSGTSRRCHSVQPAETHTTALPLGNTYTQTAPPSIAIHLSSTTPHEHIVLTANQSSAVQQRSAPSLPSPTPHYPVDRRGRHARLRRLRLLLLYCVQVSNYPTAMRVDDADEIQIGSRECTLALEAAVA
jgi:hypothetical protein